jgi:drug/metabolite transporter (DMT)-like permease
LIEYATRTSGRTARELGLVAASLAVFAWGFGPLFVRAMEVSTPTAVAYRLAFGAPVMLICARLAGGRIDGRVVREAFVPGVLFAVTLLTGFAALNKTSVANATLIGNLTPVIVLAFARLFMHERIRGQQYIAAGVAVAGIIVVVLGAGKTAGAAFTGDALAAVNVVLFAMYFLKVKQRRDTGVHSWALIGAITAIAALLAVPVCVFISDDLGAVAGWDWLYLAGMVVGPGLFGHGLMTWAQRHLEVSVASLLTLASPVISAVGAWLWLDQPMVALQIGGAVAVLGALAVIAVNARQPEVVESRLSAPLE